MEARALRLNISLRLIEGLLKKEEGAIGQLNRLNENNSAALDDIH